MELSDLDCKIYLNSRRPPELLAADLQRSLGGTIERATLHLPIGDIDIRANEEFDENESNTFPDGFLYFAAFVELYPRPDVPLDDRIDAVGSILELLWNTGTPAVAACDYEERLPHGGGYNRNDVPWGRITE